MDLIILGSGTAIPIIDRASPSYALFVKGERPMLMDMGPGTLRQLTKIGISHERIGRIFLTHFHPDHCADMVHLLFATRNPRVLERRERLIITGPTGLKKFLTALQSAFDPWLALPGTLLHVEELDREDWGRRDYGRFRVSTAPTGHTANSLAYRLDAQNGKCVVFSGDTGFSQAVVDLAKGADLLILESAFPDSDPVEGHLTPAQAGRMATWAGVKRLVLTHFYPEALAADIVSQCRTTYHGDLILAQDLLHLRI
ncbi:MAG: MBL fold metallo-hydrolase [Thermodesulfobacteriota bacterium]